MELFDGNGRPECKIEEDQRKKRRVFEASAICTDCNKVNEVLSMYFTTTVRTVFQNTYIDVVYKWKNIYDYYYTGCITKEYTYFTNGISLVYLTELSVSISTENHSYFKIVVFQLYAIEYRAPDRSLRKNNSQ